MRAPDSEPASTLHALDVLADVGALEDALVTGAAEWVGTIAEAGGGVPFVMPTAAAHPHAPWMVPSGEGGSFLTFAIAAKLLEAGVETEWLERARRWAWQRLEQPAELASYTVRFALDFLDHVPEEERARAAVDSLRGGLSEDGSLPVEGGTADERLEPLVLSPRPGLRSRALFEDAVIERNLDELEGGQHDDGGWDFDWLAWSDGQRVEWRGIQTVKAIATLRAHGRI